MEVDNKRFMDIVKTMTNECEKLANSLDRYSSFKEEFTTEEEWQQMLSNFTEEELCILSDLDERFENHLNRISRNSIY